MSGSGQMSSPERWTVSASWDESMTLHCPGCYEWITLDDRDGNWPTLAELLDTAAKHRCTLVRHTPSESVGNPVGNAERNRRSEG